MSPSCEPFPTSVVLPAEQSHVLLGVRTAHRERFDVVVLKEHAGGAPNPGRPDVRALPTVPSEDGVSNVDRDVTGPLGLPA